MKQDVTITIRNINKTNNNCDKTSKTTDNKMNKETKNRVKTSAPSNKTTSSKHQQQQSNTPPSITAIDDDAKQMVGGCCVCGDDMAFENNLLVYCDGTGCDVAVHQGCYGIVNIPDGDWYCKRCEFIRVKRNSNPTSTSSSLNANEFDQICCMLCPMKEGALKKTDNNNWAHVICGLYIPEISFGSVKTMEPIITKDIRLDRLDKKCSICEINQSDNNSSAECINVSTATSSSTATPSLALNCTATESSNEYLGLNASNHATNNNNTASGNIMSISKYSGGHVCVQCNCKSGCKLWFHVTCAQMNGLLCEDLSSTSSNSVTYSVYCKAHINKSTDSDIRRIPAFNMFSSKSKSNSMNSSKTEKQPAKAKESKKKSVSSSSSSAVSSVGLASILSTTESSNTGTSISTPTENKKKYTRTSNLNEANSDAVPQTVSMLQIPKENSKTDKKRASRSNSNNNLTSITQPTESKKQKQIDTKKTQATVTSVKKIKDSSAESIIEPVKNMSKKAVKLKASKNETVEIKTEIRPIEKTSSETDFSSLLCTNETTTNPIIVADLFLKTPETELEQKPIALQTQINNQDESDKDNNKRKLRCSISDELEIQTPNSSAASSSSTTSTKSPGHKRQRKSTDTQLKQQNNHQSTQPLTPPPSVSQDILLMHQNSTENTVTDPLTNKVNKEIDIFGNRLNSTAVFGSNVISYKNATNDSSLVIMTKGKSSEFNSKETSSYFKQPKQPKQQPLSTMPTLSFLASKKLNYNDQSPNDNVEPSTSSGSVNENINEEKKDDFPKTLEELLLKQWKLGSELIKEQSKNFDIFDLLNILKNCKEENEELENKIKELEKTHENLINLNQQLTKPLLSKTEPIVDPPPSPPQQPLSSHLLKSSPQPQQLQNLSAVSAASTPTSSPVKQPQSSIIYSASPVSVASSPHRQHPTTISSNNQSPIHNNTNKNISNVISHPDNCFYSLNSINKNGLNNINVGYSPMSTLNSFRDINQTNTPITVPMNGSSNNGQRIDSSTVSSMPEFSLMTQFQHLQQQPLVNNISKPTNMQQQQQQQQQHGMSNMQRPVFYNSMEYDQMFQYYSQIMRNNPNIASSSNPADLANIPLLHNLSNMSPTKAAATFSKAIIDSSLTNKIVQ